MNYKQMQSALLKRENLTAVFDGTVHYQDGDEYPIISYPPYEIISTGSMNHFYFDQKNDGLPPGVREVCFSDASPYGKKKKGFTTRTEIYEFHVQGVLPDFILDGLVGNSLSYTWKVKHVTASEKVEVIEDEMSSYHLVREGMIEIYGTNNPSNLHSFTLKHPYLWYFTYQHPREKIFVHHDHEDYQALLSEVLSLV